MITIREFNTESFGFLFHSDYYKITFKIKLGQIFSNQYVCYINKYIPSILVMVFSADILADWLDVGCFDNLVLTTLNRPIVPTV